MVRKRQVKVLRASKDSKVKASGLRSVQAKGKGNISRVLVAVGRDSVQPQVQLRVLEAHLVPADRLLDSRNVLAAGPVDLGRRL
ncbi:MAG TPA: hypothetical protein VJS43_05880 [Candidatus Acidoferrales bacterium]|nr:hypothetical protein [Candidatus Acidoferrales bacterium]